MQDIRIVTYRPELRDDFVRLNRQWIEQYFHIEESDINTFAHVEDYILRPGGQIFFAVIPSADADTADEVVGCCALVPHPDRQCHELAKMAVSPDHQGHGAGLLLGRALIDYAREHGVSRIFIEGNTRLKASIALYRKLGFREETTDPPTYERCDIVMELAL